MTKVIDYLTEYYPDDRIVVLHGLDKAILGITHDHNPDTPPVLVYSINKIYDQLIEEDGMTVDEAIDFSDYNIFSPCTENWPMFVEELEWT